MRRLILSRNNFEGSFLRSIAAVFTGLTLLLSTPLLAERQVAGAKAGQVGGQDAPRAKIKKIKFIKDVRFNNSRAVARSVIPARLVFDDQHGYFATPDGLFRTDKHLTGQSNLEPIGFKNRFITNLYINNEKLYVLKEAEQTDDGPASDHGFLRSDDRGDTFIPLDNSLQECLREYCGFIWPTQAEFRDNLIFLNAGGGMNLLVSERRGRKLAASFGQPAVSGLYTFGLRDN